MHKLFISAGGIFVAVCAFVLMGSSASAHTIDVSASNYLTGPHSVNQNSIHISIADTQQNDHDWNNSNHDNWNNHDWDNWMDHMNHHWSHHDNHDNDHHHDSDPCSSSCSHNNCCEHQDCCTHDDCHNHDW